VHPKNSKIFKSILTKRREIFVKDIGWLLDSMTEEVPS